MATIEIPSKNETVEVFPNKTVVDEETGEPEDFEAEFDFEDGLVKPEVPGGDNTTIEIKEPIPTEEDIDNEKGNKTFVETKLE